MGYPFNPRGKSPSGMQNLTQVQLHSTLCTKRSHSLRLIMKDRRLPSLRGAA